MGTKAKTFDCVDFKRKAQERLRAEYEARRSEFPDYYDFLRAKAEESEIGRLIRGKAAKAGAAEGG
jgi:hypothetical protein